MVDPLKKKFKAFCFKFYDHKTKDNYQECSRIFNDFTQDPLVTQIDYWWDYDPKHVKLHINGVLRSSSYKNLYAKYSAIETKISGVFMWLKDLDTMKDYNEWLLYCFRREEYNFTWYLPQQKINDATSLSTPHSTPSPMPIIDF